MYLAYIYYCDPFILPPGAQWLQSIPLASLCDPLRDAYCNIGDPFLQDFFFLTWPPTKSLWEFFRGDVTWAAAGWLNHRLKPRNTSWNSMVPASNFCGVSPLGCKPSIADTSGGCGSSGLARYLGWWTWRFPRGLIGWVGRHPSHRERFEKKVWIFGGNWNCGVSLFRVFFDVGKNVWSPQGQFFEP